MKTNNKMKKTTITVSIIFIIMAIIGTSACSSESKVDYSNAGNWVSIPELTKDVDVFYVYPTVSNNASGTMDINNDAERKLAVGILKAQASVFEDNANVFAPYYRQMTTKVQMPDNPNALATDTKEFKKGAADIEDAFDYYINNLNNGRPFIIAGHSQGTMALIELIKNNFGKSEVLRNQLIAAYLIGYTVTNSDLEAAGLAAAQGEDDTGVVITYNTQSTTSEGGPMLLPGAHCINPLNWKTDTIYVDSTMNKGAVFFDDATGTFIKEVPQYCSAKIDPVSMALTTTIVDTLNIGPYKKGVYHRYDYAFWYKNLQDNVKVRIKAYLNK